MTHSGIQGRLLIGAFTFAMAAWTITAAGSPSAGASAGPTTIAVEAVPEPLLSIGSSGGLIDYRFKFSRLPKVVVASTGQLFTQGPTTMIYPGPMLPNVRARTLTKAGVVRLRTLVARAGLDRAADYGRPAIADVPALVIRYLPANATFVTNTLPSFGVHEESLTSAQRAGRAKVRALMVALEAPRRAFGRQISSESAYIPTRFAILTSEPRSALDGLTPAVIDWPIPATPLAAVGECAVVEGRNGSTLAAALRNANHLTQFRDAGRTWQLTARVLLPGDPACTPLPA